MWLQHAGRRVLRRNQRPVAIRRRVEAARAQRRHCCPVRVRTARTHDVAPMPRHDDVIWRRIFEGKFIWALGGETDRPRVVSQINFTVYT